MKRGTKLSESQQAAIIAAVATGMSQTQAALNFGVHPNTVNTLIRKVKHVPNMPPLTREQRIEATTDRAIDKMHDSVQDDWRAADSHLRRVYGDRLQIQQDTRILVAWADGDVIECIPTVEDNTTTNG